jgi:hypothetical protein
VETTDWMLRVASTTPQITGWGANGTKNSGSDARTTAVPDTAAPRSRQRGIEVVKNSDRARHRAQSTRGRLTQSTVGRASAQHPERPMTGRGHDRAMECKTRPRESRGLARTTPCNTKSLDAMEIDATSAATPRYNTESIPRGIPYVINDVTPPAALDERAVPAVTDEEDGAMEGGTM